MAKRFMKPTINWVEFEKRVPLEQKAKFLAFKAKADVYLRRVEANPSEPPKIDWEMYKKIVPVSGLVDKFKTAYQQLKIPYPKDSLSTQVDEQWKTLEPEIKKFCDDMQKDIEVAKKELNRLNALPKVEDITLEMFHDLYPKDALDPINRPTMWPHTPEEQLGYKPPEKKVEEQKKK